MKGWAAETGACKVCIPCLIGEMIGFLIPSLPDLWER